MIHEKASVILCFTTIAVICFPDTIIVLNKKSWLYVRTNAFFIAIGIKQWYFLYSSRGLGGCNDFPRSIYYQIVLTRLDTFYNSQLTFLPEYTFTIVLITDAISPITVCTIKWHDFAWLSAWSSILSFSKIRCFQKNKTAQPHTLIFILFVMFLEQNEKIVDFYIYFSTFSLGGAPPRSCHLIVQTVILENHFHMFTFNVVRDAHSA